MPDPPMTLYSRRQPNLLLRARSKNSLRTAFFSQS
nr:MAG TPA_asm: hypothetical protein [Caudoviricetes sp.]